jgi:hypothetical protein
MPNKATAELAESECTLEQISAYHEMMHQTLLDNHMRLADSIKDLDEQAQRHHDAAFQRLDPRLQQSIHNPRVDLLERALGKRPASRNISDDLLATDRLVDFVEMLEETESKIRALCAKSEETTSLHHQLYRSTQVEDMLDTDFFPDADGNMVRGIAYECRFHEVALSRFQISCGEVGGDDQWVREIDEHDIYVKLAVVILGVLVGTLAISCAVTSILCAVLRLLGGPQVRTFGMGWVIVVAVGWVICHVVI